MNLTQEQNDIIAHVRRGQGNLLIEALAGAGKTSTLIEALKVIPQRSIMICAFNKRIAEEIKAKLPKLPKSHVVHVKTFHAIGLSIIKARFPKVTVDPDHTERLITQAAGDRPLAYQLRRAAIKLLRTYKEVELPFVMSLLDEAPQSAAIGDEDLYDIGHDYDLFGKLNPSQIDRVVEVVGLAYRQSLELPEQTTIDYCDMIWLPFALGLTIPSRYQAVLVDEWQDLSPPQFHLVKSLCTNNGRLIMAGDRFQAIYAWRGAIGENVRTDMIDRLKAQTLPLTASFRCSRAVITQAQELVPQIQAGPDAEDGSVTEIGLVDVPRMLMGGHHERIHTFVLSRTNADLLDCALFLWREGSRFQLNAGEQMLEPLFDLLERLDTRDETTFRKSLGSWYGAECARAEASNATSWRERIDEQYAMLSSAVSYIKPQKIAGLLRDILQTGTTGVLLSTVHKVKGLEADRVFLLKQTFARHRAVPASIGISVFRPEVPVVPQTFFLREQQQDERLYEAVPPSQEDLNIEYVAITRSRDHLIWVDLDRRDTWVTDLVMQICASSDLSNVATPAIEKLWIDFEAEGVRLTQVGQHDRSKKALAVAVHVKAILDHRNNGAPMPSVADFTRVRKIVEEAKVRR